MNVYREYFTDGKTGITSTSANHLANLAKQEYQAEEAILSSVNFITSKIRLINSAEGSGNEITTGFTKHQLRAIPGILTKIGELKGFIAWIREALAAKDNLINNVEDEFSFDAWVNEHHPEYRSIVDFAEHQPGVIPAELNMSIQEKAKFLFTEAMAATYGSFIHPNGSGDNAYKQLLNKTQNPRSVSLNGADTIITEYTPSVLTSDVNTIFNEIRSDWRSYEAEVNSVKFKLNEQDDENRKKRAREYMEARTQATELAKTCRAEYKEFIETKRQEYRNLKILIPEYFMETYVYLSNLGKK